MEIKDNYLWYYKNTIIVYPQVENDLYNIDKDMLIKNENEYEIIDIRFLLFLIKEKHSSLIECLLASSKNINPKYENILQEKLFKYKELIVWGEDRKIEKEIENNIKDIIIYAMNNNNNLDYNSIFTKAELKAFSYIIKKLENNNWECDVVVNQLTNETLISNPVFRSLFYKLKENKIAEIDSRGVKGTHIKIISHFDWIKNISL